MHPSCLSRLPTDSYNFEEPLLCGEGGISNTEPRLCRQLQLSSTSALPPLDSRAFDSPDGLIFLLFFFNGAGPLSVDAQIYDKISNEEAAD